MQLLHHENALQISPNLAKVYKNQLKHDPLDIHFRQREIASSTDVVPVGSLYQNRRIPATKIPGTLPVLRTPEIVRTGLNAEFDKYTV